MKIKNQSVSHTPVSRFTNRRKLVMAAAVLVVAIGWYLFRPELIFVSRSVNEEFPGTATQQMTASNASPTMLSQGRFHGVSHETKDRCMTRCAGSAGMDVALGL
jgi:hypothetical protein